MLSTLFSHRFFRYLIVGGSSALLDIGLLILLKNVFHISATFALALEQIFINIYNFTLQKYWTFSHTGKVGPPIRRYLTLLLTNYFFSLLMMYLWHEKLGFDYRIVRIATIILLVPTNFFLYKFWVYRKSEPYGKS